MRRRDFLALPALGLAAQTRLPGAASWEQSGILPAPDDRTAWPAYREQLAQWRTVQRQRISYDDALYRRPDFAWTRTSFSCCFLMMCDEQFWDRQRGAYQVNDWLDSGVREFGGYDSVVLWHAYPRIGLDSRNQFDFYRDMPGGLAGVRAAAAQFQSRGVKVYIEYNPWDTGTRREGRSDVDAIVAMVKELGADGVFLDTMKSGAAEFRAKLDAARPGVVLESEISLDLENIHDHHMSWAQGFQDSKAPGILRNKWFERRHMQHHTRRFSHDHTGELHAAWMNGSGIMIWENVFGSWVGICPRDRSLLRAMLPIQRRYVDLFCGENWTPLVPTVSRDVYASLWEDKGVRLWTAVNRATEPRTGVHLNVPHRSGDRYFDLITGQELAPGALTAALPPRGLAGWIAAPPAHVDAGFQQFLKRQAATHSRASTDAGFPLLEVRLTPAPTATVARTPPDMVAIGPARLWNVTTEYRNRETGFYTGTEYFTLKAGHGSFHLEQITRDVDLPAYAIDETPVTNAQYAAFLKQSGYRPKHADNFLKHWVAGAPPAGLDDHPVVYVDLDDARAYAAWAHKRLPNEDEWQYAAEGPDRLRYPWGNGVRNGVCNAGETGGTTPVKAFPRGRSPFGCYDMSGNTWEWTESERTDGRTHFAMIRGGSYYEAKGSHWYMDGGPQPGNFSAKALLMWPGLDRCATVGFRCAVTVG